MKAHFITSRPSLEKDFETLQQILKVIRDSGHSIAYDWIDGAFKREIEAKTPASDWNAIYKDNLAAIAQADVVIAETTYENFAVGYQVAVAVQQKKPVLLLRHEGADKNAFVTGIDDGWVKHKIYVQKDVDSIVQDFLAENDITTKDMRFNFFIDRGIYNYLRWAALKTGKTKAEVLRELVNREIENKDQY
jgi:nucleoside 2-deoxyribosyltransferase